MTDLTIDEAEAWRAGYRAALEAAARELRSMGALRRIQAIKAPGASGLLQRAADLECAAGLLPETCPIPDPPPALLADGLCGRGA